MKEINKKIKTAYTNSLPFVVYNKPNENKVTGIFQKNALLHTVTKNLREEGFVFAPFNAKRTAIFFPLKESIFIRSNFIEDKIKLPSQDFYNEKSKEKHVALVKKGIQSIVQEEFKKVVLSRKEIVDLTDFDIVEVFNKLLQTYPNAFVYVWYHPEIGLWMGATPEVLLKVKNNYFTTMALAGTQEYQKDKKPNWSSKEIEEQELVTQYIVNKLAHFSKNLNRSETTTVKAGALLHLKTDINGELDAAKDNSLFSLIDVLHPTPAVCGLPKIAAKQFILENENYERSFYTGYLGELNKNDGNDSNLYVNLRCMEIIKNQALVYVGGGITKASIPEKEWEETVAKSTIMIKVL